jgi:hypothetical protein
MRIFGFNFFEIQVYFLTYFLKFRMDLELSEQPTLEWRSTNLIGFEPDQAPTY